MPLRKCHLQYISFCFCSTWWNIYFWWHTCNILQPHPILKEPFLLGCILRTWTKRRMQHVDVSYIYIYVPWFAFMLGYTLKCCYNKLLPSWELTDPMPSLLKMIFLFARWDMWSFPEGNQQDTATNLRYGGCLPSQKRDAIQECCLSVLPPQPATPSTGSLEDEDFFRMIESVGG